MEGVMARMVLGNGTVDENATAKLRAIKRFPAKNDGTLNSAVLSAAYYAKKMNETMFVYQGNSNMHRVHRVSNKPGEYLNPISNDGNRVISVSPELTVSEHEVIRGGTVERTLRELPRDRVPESQRFAEWLSRTIIISEDFDRFGDNKLFIASVYEIGEFDSELSLEEFKSKLLHGHRAGTIVLSRADLTSAMDPDMVSRSEIQDPLGAEYHFINKDQTRAAVRRASGLKENVKMPRGSVNRSVEDFKKILKKGVILVAGDSSSIIDPYAEEVDVAIAFNVTGYGPHTAAIYAVQNRLSRHGHEEALQEASELLEEWEREKYPLPPDEEEHRTETYDGRTWTLPAREFCDAIYNNKADKFIDVEEDEDEETSDYEDDSEDEDN